MIAQSRAIPVILTRPEEQGARFAKDLQDRYGRAIDVIQSPLLAPQFLTPALGSGPWAAIIFTSATAVAAFGRLNTFSGILSQKAYCVGHRTAEAARAIGLDAISANGDSKALCATILAAREPGPLLYLRGEEALGDIAKNLRLAGIETHEVIVYSELAQTLSDEARNRLSTDHPVILPVFSPRTARILRQELLAMSRVLSVATVAISPAVAEELKPFTATWRFVADRPDAPSMLSAIGQALTVTQAS